MLFFPLCRTSELTYESVRLHTHSLSMSASVLTSSFPSAGLMAKILLVLVSGRQLFTWSSSTGSRECVGKHTALRIRPTVFNSVSWTYMKKKKWAGLGHKSKNRTLQPIFGLVTISFALCVLGKSKLSSQMAQIDVTPLVSSSCDSSHCVI